jgi:uncharacterized membrane protein YhaH (DUF805 family)
MDFMTAVKTCFSKYVDFNGRARRSEYWFFVLFYVIVYVVASILDGIIGGQIFTIIAALGFFLPSLAVTVRRLHDTDRSGWWILIGLIPIVGFIVMIVFTVQDSKPGDNQYGPNPKTGAAGGYPPPPPPAYGTGQYNG